MLQQQKEVWLRGTLPGIPRLLQPVAHALLQAEEDVNDLMVLFPQDLLWKRPAGVASPGFHLLHLSGVLDRMFTYAAGNPLSAKQFNDLAAEELEHAVDVNTLTIRFSSMVNSSIQKLSLISEDELNATRLVGRAQIPTTLMGLLVHAAEHTQRHIGQLSVTVRMLKNSS